MKLNIIKALNEVSEEQFSKLEMHPYYGLADSKGWLTRYPKEGLRISASDMAVFVKHGGSLDSCGVYGVNPYKGFEGLSPLKAAEFQLAAFLERWDNVPTYYNYLITVNDDCSFQDYLTLHKGAQILHELNKYGIETNASLFTLARKNYLWLNRKIAANFDFSNPAHMEWARNYRGGLHEFASHGNIQFMKLVEDERKYEARREYKYINHKRLTIKTDKLIAWSLKNMKWSGEYQTMKGVDMRYKVSYTSLGTCALGRKFLHLKSRDDSRVISARVRKFGQFSAAKIDYTYFVWVTSEGFDSHVECVTINYGVKTLKEKLSKRKEREDVLERGIVSFRSFRKMTSSCLEGTKNWLLDNQYFHFYNLLSTFGSWDEVFATDVADIKFEMTPEFMESIRFRF